MFSHEQRLLQSNFGKPILLLENINLPLFDLYFLLMKASLQKQADWENVGSVWIFSLCGPFPLRSPLPLTPAALFWQNGLSGTPGSHSTDAPAGAGNFSACCLQLASNVWRPLHLWIEPSETIHTPCDLLMLILDQLSAKYWKHT